MKNTLDKSKSPPPTQNPRAESLTLEDYRTFFESLDKNAISSATNAKGDIIYVAGIFVIAPRAGISIGWLPPSSRFCELGDVLHRLIERRYQQSGLKEKFNHPQGVAHNQ